MNDKNYLQITDAFRRISSIVQFEANARYPLNYHFVENGYTKSSPTSESWLSRAALSECQHGGTGRGNPAINSKTSAPVQRTAHAYAQGSDIHLGPGQEKHLPHEAWHVVQQKASSKQPVQRNAMAYSQGSDIHFSAGQEKHLPHEAWHVVQQVKGPSQGPIQRNPSKVAINDSTSLESEADQMGRASAGLFTDKTTVPSPHAPPSRNGAPVQRVVQKQSSGPNPPLVSGKPNTTGLPENLKAGIEILSGISMADVRVHLNSSKPAELSALAYAQGNDIHVAPGQEQHLPHEAWHVVQQKQGRVQATVQMKSINGTPVNDDRYLEHEATVMGARAVSSSSLRLQNAPEPLRPILSQLTATATKIPENAKLQKIIHQAVQVLNQRRNRLGESEASNCQALLELALELHWYAHREIVSRRDSSNGPLFLLCYGWLCQNATDTTSTAKAWSKLSKSELIQLLSEPCGYMVLYTCLDQA